MGIGQKGWLDMKSTLEVHSLALSAYMNEESYCPRGVQGQNDDVSNQPSARESSDQSVD